jgi:hypothetical protein
MEIEAINRSNKKAYTRGDIVVDMADLDVVGLITALDARKCFKHSEILHRKRRL